MITYESLPMSIKTPVCTLLFLGMSGGICLSIFVGAKQGRVKQALLPVFTGILAVILLLYASVIRAERAKPVIPAVALWFEQQPVVFPLLVLLACIAFFIMVTMEEYTRRKNAITASSIKESIDHLQTGLCFSYPNGLVLLTNHRMNVLSYAIFGKPIQNANLFWQELKDKEPAEGTVRLQHGDQPEFTLNDGTVWTFKRDELNGVIQIAAADTTHQHRLVTELQDRNRELEDMNARIRSYGSKVDEYVISRERLETRVNLHGFLGQALLMTRHYLRYESGDPKKIIDIWQRNIDVLRMEAEPQRETDTLSSLKNAAGMIGMHVHVSGKLSVGLRLQKLIAATGAEALTNAVRHAGARQLWITIEETETEYVIRYTNDGSVPDAPIAEGGGLSTTRRKVEAAGGRMRIESSPRFILTIIFGKEVTMDV